MKYTKFLILFALLLPVFVYSRDVSHTAMDGCDSVPAEYFRTWYHCSDLIYYLEALNDHSIVETTTYGQWWIPDRLTIAVEGLTYTANRYYIDGMRADDRFQPGSTQFVPNMQRFNMAVNTHTSQMYFDLDTASTDYVQANYNFGQLGSGEPAAGTKAVFNITHRSPMESADTYKHITARRHLRGAGQAETAYTFHDADGNAYRQHLYFAYGRRAITREDQCGLILDDPLYDADYYKVQADGYLPMKPNRVFSQLGYRLNFSGRPDAGSEYFYNFGEVYDLKNYTATLYAKRQYLTTGLTWATNVVNHKNQQFSKNVIDQDGENFYPWVADGKTHELSWAVNYEQPLLDWLSINLDAYNSLFYFTPQNKSFTNEIYLQSPVNNTQTPLYRYEWSSSAYVSGLLENTLQLKAQYDICKQLSMKAHLGVTLDAMLLKGKSKVSPNWLAGINFDLHPCRWFEMGLTLAHQRLAYTADYLRYFSNDYMNANVYFAGTNNLFTTTGGQYHQYADKLQQTSYIEFDIPIHFHFGRHEIVLQQSYKKFYHVWHTNYVGGVENNGTFESIDGNDVYFQNVGVTQYEIGYSEPFGMNFLMNSPYYFSQLTRYTYTGKKVTVGLSWQSMQAAGYTGLGNGALSNSMGMLSETTANPNTSNVLNNTKGGNRGVGRHDLDKGYVCRFYLAYNICKWVQTGVTLKWTDGKPFTDYQYYQNGGQVAILPLYSRGTNPTDGDFGKRHCAKYNIDLHVQGKWEINGVPMSLNLECYNIWDFCHDLAEMSFVQDIPQAARASMIMDIPIGLLATFTVDL